MENFAKHAPYLLTACNHNGKGDDHFTLYSIADKINYEFDEQFLHKKLIIGSQYGWIFVLDQHCEPFLLNPLSGESMPLPSITTLTKVRPCHSIVSGDMISYFCCCRVIVDVLFINYTFNFCLEEFIFRKVVISSNPSMSSSNFNVAALFGYTPYLVVTREGEGKWNILQKDVRYKDILFCRNGKLLCLTDMGALQEVEFKGNDDVVITEISSHKLVQFLQVDHKFDLYLAEDCARRVLIILRTYDMDDDTTIIYDVKVFRFIRGNGVESKWEPLMTLDGEAIFVGTNASVSLAKEDIHGEISPNTVYFINEWWDWDTMAGDEERGWNRDICAYNLTNKSIKLCTPVKLQQCTRLLPVWIHLSSTH